MARVVRKLDMVDGVIDEMLEWVICFSCQKLEKAPIGKKGASEQRGTGAGLGRVTGCKQ